VKIIYKRHAHKTTHFATKKYKHPNLYSLEEEDNIKTRHTACTTLYQLKKKMY